METFKYKFSFVSYNVDTCELQTKNWGRRKFYLEDWLPSCSIPYRERTGKVWYMGYSKRRPFIETEKIDWRWTIYNLKVIKIKSARREFKITFKVRLTPKEAFTLGEYLKRMRYIENVSYKKVLKASSE